MPQNVISVFRLIDIGGTDGLERAGFLTVLDDDGFQDDIFNDIESAGSGETNGDQEIIASEVAELGIGNTIRTRGIFQFTNLDTGETFNAIEVFSETAGNPIETFFIFTSTAPDWLFDDTPRSISLVNANGTIPFTSIVCFCAGTGILMADGTSRAIETLRPGDLVHTADGASEAIQWIGRRTITVAQQVINPKLRPILIHPGALGPNTPSQTLSVSPQHRILVNSAIAFRMFGRPEVLIPANALLDLDGVEVSQDLADVHYFHMMLRQHDVVVSNGAVTETLLAGPEALKALTPDARAELRAIFPEIFSADHVPQPARYIPRRGQKVRNLVARHRKNRKPLVA